MLPTFTPIFVDWRKRPAFRFVVIEALTKLTLLPEMSHSLLSLQKSICNIALTDKTTLFFKKSYKKL